jgi:hypothetical protein
MPADHVSSVVTDKILKYDQETCRTILEKIFREQQVLDKKKEIQKIERVNLREKLKQTHNKVLEVSFG